MHLVSAIRTCLIAGSLLTGSIAGRAQETPRHSVDVLFTDLTKPGSPGCAIGIYRDGKIIYEKGYGLANVEENVPITPQTVFDVGSVSKQFTAASVLLLEKQGKLRLDDDVRKYIPEMPDYHAENGQKITILNLLNHTSGIRDYGFLFPLAGVNDDNVTTDDDALGIIGRQKGLNFPPGTEWQYSNSGYFLLSLIVKRVSGKTLKDFAFENVFHPLGMLHTQYRNDHTALIPHRALAYSPGENGGYRLSVSYAEATGDGMVQTTIEDLIKWDENFYTGKVGGKELIVAMEEPGRLNDLREVRYAKGLFIDDYRGLRSIYHSGGSGGYRAYLLRFPDEHFSAACLCNLSTLSRCGPSHASARARRIYAIADDYLAGVMTPKKDLTPVIVPSEQLQAFVGTYRDPTSREVWRVVLKDGKLSVDFGGQPVELRALSPTTFEPVDYPFPTDLRFESGTLGTPRNLIVQRPAFTTTFEAVEEPKLSETQLAGFAGNYWSDELQATYQLAMKNGGLWMQALIGADGVVRTGTIPFDRLRPVAADEVTLDGAPITITFTRNQNGNVIGFVLDGFLQRGIVFTRKGEVK